MIPYHHPISGLYIAALPETGSLAIADYLLLHSIPVKLVDADNALHVMGKSLPKPTGKSVSAELKDSVFLGSSVSTSQTERQLLVYCDPWDFVSYAEINLGLTEQDALNRWMNYHTQLIQSFEPGKQILISSYAFMQQPGKLLEVLNTHFGFRFDEVNAWKYYELFYNRNHYHHGLNLQRVLAYKKDPKIFDLLVQLHQKANWAHDKLLPQNLHKKVGVVVPCYNLGHLLEETIASVERSINPCYEISIVDDGSTGIKTVEVLTRLKQMGYRIIHQENQGLCKALNHGITESSSSYILVLSADDKCDPLLLAEGVLTLENEAHTGVVYCNPKTFEGSYKLWIVPDFDITRLLATNFIVASSVFRKELWQQSGGFDPMADGNEDWDMWMSMAKRGAGFKHINSYLFHYRTRLGSKIEACNLPENRKKLSAYLIEKHKELFLPHINGVYANMHFTMGQLNEQVVHLGSYKQHDDLMRKGKANLGVLGKVMYKLLEKAGQLSIHADDANFYQKYPVLPNDSAQPQLRVVHSGWRNKLSYKLGIIINKLRANLGQADKGNSRISKILFYAKLKSKSVYKLFSSVLRMLYIASERWPITIIRHHKNGLETVYSGNSYEYWMAKNFPSKSTLLGYKKELTSFTTKPLFRILLPVENSSIVLLTDTVNAMREQVYASWELVFICGKETQDTLMEEISKWQKEESRFVLFKTDYPVHSAEAKNEVNEKEADKDNVYYAIIKIGDRLPPEALYQYARHINEFKAATHLIYSDDDCIHDDGHHYNPRFKQDWNRDTLMAQPYIGNSYVIKASYVYSAGGWKAAYQTAHEYELLLRMSNDSNAKVVHLPFIGYHILSGSICDNSQPSGKQFYEDARKAITDTASAIGEMGTVKTIEGNGGFSIRYQLTAKPLVSIIIPTKDKIDILHTCIESIFQKSTYTAFEIVLLDNNSSEPAFFEQLAQWEKKEPERFKCVRTEHPFNFAYLMNLGAQHSKGEYLILLNNDTEVITPDWIEAMLEQAQRKSIGVVGIKLLYPNNTIQHAGVVIGLGGGAGHVFPGRTPNAVTYMNYLNNITNYSALTAACIMIKKSKFDEVSGFDESYAVEFNDVDFCLRVKEKGYQNVYIPHAVLYHYESISRGHPLANSVSYNRHLAELDRLKSRWRQMMINDPCYNPNLSLTSDNMEIKI